MERFRSFFMGTRPSKSRETVAELRKQASDIKIRARALKKLANEEREMAKEFLKSGNKQGAQKALIRRKKYQKDLNSLMNKAAMVNTVIEAIAKAEQNDKLLKVLSASKVVLDKTASQDRLTQAEEIMSGLEMALENVDYIEERLGESDILDDPLDVELADINDEMNVLMAEIEAETSGRKEIPARTVQKEPPTPRRVGPHRRVLDAPMEELPSSPKPTISAEADPEEELRAEIERIKREMREELG